MKPDSNECPNCSFAGKDTKSNKFSDEEKNQFPKGYAAEKFAKMQTVKKSGQEITEFVRDQNKQIIFEMKKRCPICGHREDVKEVAN
ncbi:MAG: hypothetical protein K5785_00990 [Nitrosarchaeum sp.]|nr:hypothetical protein [Nitrosarchaeum sp.]